ncbi:MAG: methyltransferase domain-containing protein [Deinococcota bacterium]
MTDIYFDGIAEGFNTSIYNTSKGFIRLGVLWHDLCEAVPNVQQQRLRVLDVGGGMGQLAIRFAKLGHDVVLADPSEDMLARARANIASANLNIQTVHTSAQDLHQHVEGTFDLVLCHAVLGWVHNPADVIGILRDYVAPDGHLSLMFYNQNAAIFKRVMQGDMTTFRSPDAAKEVAQAGPQTSDIPEFAGARALQLETITRYLEDADLQIQHKAGIRIFHDHIPEDVRESVLEALLEVEINFRCTEPFASLAQHIHLICTRAS